MNQVRKTKEKPVKRQRIGFRWLALIAVLFAELLVYTVVRTEATQTILRISRSQAELAALISYNRELTLERDRLKSDARIVRIARTKLGLTSDVFNQTIYLKGDDS